MPSRSLLDLAVVASACAVAVVLAVAPAVRDLVPLPAAHLVLTVAAAAAGVGAAILAEVLSRLCDDPRPSWIAAALTLYCLVVLPATVLAVGAPDEPGLLTVRLVTYLVALLLLVVSIRPPRRSGRATPWVVAAAGAVLATAGLAVDDPPGAARAASTALAVAVLLGWTAVAVAFVVEGGLRRSSPRLRVGLGLVVLAAAQMYRAAAGVDLLDPVFSSLRLVGMLAVLAGFAQLVQRAVSDVRSRQWAQQEELAMAALHMERASELAAERDHELRNGLAGLAGITHLLSSGADGEQQRLREAVLSELGRLHTILDGGPVGYEDPDGPARHGTEYAVEPVLSGLAVLRRSSGARVGLDVAAGLRACGDSAVLAQVVTNLLANCERHAPGAPVTIRAWRRDDQVVVEVRDEGPGLRSDIGRDVLTRGVHDAAAGGSGLGLHISARLVAREGGSLEVRTVYDRAGREPVGAVATVTVPAAAPSAGDGRSATRGAADPVTTGL